MLLHPDYVASISPGTMQKCLYMTTAWETFEEDGNDHVIDTIQRDQLMLVLSVRVGHITENVWLFVMTANSRLGWVYADHVVKVFV